MEPLANTPEAHATNLKKPETATEVTGNEIDLDDKVHHIPDVKSPADAEKDEDDLVHHQTKTPPPFGTEQDPDDLVHGK